MNEYTLKLDPNDMRILMAALGNLPYAQVAQLIAKVQQQCAPKRADSAPSPSPASDDFHQGA